MQRLSLVMSVSAAVFAGGFLMSRHGKPAGAHEATVAKPKRVLRHVVLFKFKKTATKKQIQRVVREFAALPSKIDAIHDFEMGTDVSVEKKAKGFTRFVVTFRDEKGRDEYLPHSAHKAFVKIVGPVLDDVLVFDYWTT